MRVGGCGRWRGREEDGGGRGGKAYAGALVKQSALLSTAEERAGAVFAVTPLI